MRTVVELAERFSATGDTNSLGFWYGPASVGLNRMYRAIEADEPDQVVGIAHERIWSCVGELGQDSPFVTMLRRTGGPADLRGYAETQSLVVDSRSWACCY